MAVTQEAEIPARLAHWERPAAASRRVAQIRKAFRLLLLYVIAGVIAAICLIPILWMVKTSFETPSSSVARRSSSGRLSRRCRTIVTCSRTPTP